MSAKQRKKLLALKGQEGILATEPLLVPVILLFFWQQGTLPFTCCVDFRRAKPPSIDLTKGGVFLNSSCSINWKLYNRVQITIVVSFAFRSTIDFNYIEIAV